MTHKQLTVVEGPRNSGKTYLLENTKILDNSLPVYKFPFVRFIESGDMQEGPTTHAFGLSKEVMLHDLIHKGHIDRTILMDRGIISHWVWSLLNCRQDKMTIINEIVSFKLSGYLEFCNFVFVTGESPFERGSKDRYDEMTYQTELEAYEWVFAQIQRLAGPVPIKFENKYDDATLKSFRNLMFSLDIID